MNDTRPLNIRPKVFLCFPWIFIHDHVDWANEDFDGFFRGALSRAK